MKEELLKLLAEAKLVVDHAPRVKVFDLLDAASLYAFAKLVRDNPSVDETIRICNMIVMLVQARRYAPSNKQEPPESNAEFEDERMAAEAEAKALARAEAKDKREREVYEAKAKREREVAARRAAEAADKAKANRTTNNTN